MTNTSGVWMQKFVENYRTRMLISWETPNCRRCAVTWNQADTYCRWTGARLPTEAEWEYSARGLNGGRYPWGDEIDGSLLNYCDANCELHKRNSDVDDGYARTAPVGSYPDGASWVGALDMAGNVWEWTAGLVRPIRLRTSGRSLRTRIRWASDRPWRFLAHQRRSRPQRVENIQRP